MTMEMGSPWVKAVGEGLRATVRVPCLWGLIIERDCQDKINCLGLL